MRFHSLEQYKTGQSGDTMQLGFPVPQTPDGRVYRYSPNEDAHPRHFVLGNVQDGFAVSDQARVRMKLTPRSQETVCPYSGSIEPDENFIHPVDVEAAMEVMKKAVIRDVSDALSEMLSDVARGSRGVITHKAGSRPPLGSMLYYERQDLLRSLTCDHCGRDYGVYAIGLFCPDCGAPNLRLHFQREVDLVSDQVAIAESLAEAQQELAYRLLGNAHEDVLTAFEAIQKAVHHYAATWREAAPRAVKPVGNDFQNIERSQKRFSEFGIDPFSNLEPTELDTLALNIQKRHVIGHNLGVVDAKFAASAGEVRLGETVVLVGSDILAFAALAQKVVNRLDDWLCS
jgi:hypothetical protein